MSMHSVCFKTAIYFYFCKKKIQAILMNEAFASPFPLLLIVIPRKIPIPRSGVYFISQFMLYAKLLRSMPSFYTPKRLPKSLE